MKRYLLLAAALLAAPAAFAAAADDVVASNARLRRETIGLLRQGKLAESRQHLAGVTALNGVKSSATETTQQWIMVALHLSDRAEKNLAYVAAAEALTLASALPRGGSNDAERASCLANAGYLCERVLHDNARAAAFYDAALVASPGHERTKQRRQQLETKIKRQESRNLPRP